MDPYDDFDDGIGGPPGGMGGPPGMGPPGMGPPGMDPYGGDDFGGPMGDPYGGGMGGPPMGGPGAGGGGGISGFSWVMFFRKSLSVLTILAVIFLEAAIAIQNAQLKNVAEVLRAKNSFRRRDGISPVSSLVSRQVQKPKPIPSSCGYYKGFDVPTSASGRSRSVVYHMATAIAFIGLLYCEWPGPREAAEVMQCSRWVMPPIGKIGLFTFSVLQMWLASSTLNHYVGTVSYITGWIMLVSALFGFFFSLIWMGRMKAASQVAAGGGAGAAGGAGMPMGMDPMMDDEMGMPPGGGPPMDDFDDGMGPGGPPPY